jgi:hypothetical protein
MRDMVAVSDSKRVSETDAAEYRTRGPRGAQYCVLEADDEPTFSYPLAQVQLPSTTITIPSGQTDATVTPIATGPVPNNGLSIGIVGDLFAGYAAGRQQSSLGVLPIFYGTGLSNESIIGGNPVTTGTVTLLQPAPSGGTTIRLVSSDSSLVRPPASVSIPAGGTGSDFTISTSAVSFPVRAYIDSRTDVDGYRAPQASIVLMPAESPTPAATLSSLSLSSSSVLTGAFVTGTITLTAPAPTSGSVVTLSASPEGQQIAPASVTVPAGSINATFAVGPAPQVNVKDWVLVQAHDGTSGASQARLLEIDPAPGTPALLAIGPADQEAKPLLLSR